MRQSKNTILIIEDDPATAELMTDVLAAAGYEPLLAREGSEALRMIRERHPSAITLDLALPGVDGRSFLLSLRSEEQTKRTPVIVVSANSENLNAFERRTVNQVIPKPFDVEDLLTAVKRVMSRREAAGRA
jgi:DNA-binding response OmpR family regulator